MAKPCPNCGNILPRDDARFCSNCGSAVPVPARPPLKEQIAFPARPKNLPERPVVPAVSAPPRELRSRVWQAPITKDVKDGQVSDAEQQPSANALPGVNHQDQAGVEDVPTSQLNSVPAPSAQNQVEQLDTRPYRQYRPSLTQTPSFPGGPPQPTSVPGPVTPLLPVSAPGIQPFTPVQPASRPAQPLSSRPAMNQSARRGGKRRALVVGALLVVLLIGGAATWLFTYHPFDVPAITQTTTSFQNASLGVALRYPQGWTAQLDTKHNAAYFYDANHTDQFNVNAVPKGTLSVQQYIKNTTGQLGMTGEKTLAPLIFAGQSWQQVSGSVLQSGATYTETLLVTTRADRIYALLLMSPTPIYTNADRLFFAPVRASFQFLSA